MDDIATILACATTSLMKKPSKTSLILSENVIQDYEMWVHLLSQPVSPNNLKIHSLPKCTRHSQDNRHAV